VLPPLTEWESFYVIVGSSAAALTGLQFVVIALSTEARLGGEQTLSAFATPTIVHFCAVLLLAAFISTPGQTRGSLSLCLAIAGFGGLVYAIWVVIQTRQQTDYKPVFEDWLFHAGLPVFAYACLFVAGLMVFWRPAPALYVVAATALILLFIGIHNAWDAAVYMAMRRKETERPPRDSG
jgi:hypothetical protein